MRSRNAANSRPDHGDRDTFSPRNPGHRFRRAGNNHAFLTHRPCGRPARTPIASRWSWYSWHQVDLTMGDRGSRKLSEHNQNQAGQILSRIPE